MGANSACDMRTFNGCFEFTSLPGLFVGARSGPILGAHALRWSVSWLTPAGSVRWSSMTRRSRPMCTAGSRVVAPMSTNDVMSTALAAERIALPDSSWGDHVHPLQGRSLMLSLTGQTSRRLKYTAHGSAIGTTVWPVLPAEDFKNSNVQTIAGRNPAGQAHEMRSPCLACQE